MRKIFIMSLIIFSLVTCGKPNNIDRVAIKYIEYLNEDIEHNGMYNILITEIENKEKTIYRLSGSNNNLERENLPYKYFKNKEKYVFIFNSNKFASGVLEKKLEKEGLLEEYQLYFSLDNYPEWIFILCDNGKNLLFKDSWYRSLDEIEEINNFKCN